MKLSIIIPTYLRVKMLLDVISDLINQSEKDFEIIIVDDNSQDTTRESIEKLEKEYNFIKYKENKWKWQRDWKKTWLDYSKWEYIIFLEDDVKITDKDFIKKLYKILNNKKVIVSKVIMLDKNKKNIKKDPKIYTIKPWILIELSNWKINEWKSIREIFPFMETWTIFHRNLSKYFIDKNLILDCYWESYCSWIKLLQRWIKLEFNPSLEIYHIWADKWWSKKFQKKSMLYNFTEFHYGYFYNMIYLHSRYRPFYIFIWLPFYIWKSIIALIENKNMKWFFMYAIKPILKSIYTNFLLRNFK